VHVAFFACVARLGFTPDLRDTENAGRKTPAAIAATNGKTQDKRKCQIAQLKM
jgi:hypothetical protein